MKAIQVLLLVILMTAASCVTIVKWKYGITKPREETPEKIISFLHQHKYPMAGQYIFTDSTEYFQTIRNSVCRKYLLSHMIFNSKGTLLLRDTAKCQWSGYEIIKALSTDSVYKTVDGLQLGDILDLIRPLEEGQGQDTLRQQPDFTAIVTWATFLGSYNDRLFDLEDAVKYNLTARIRLIWLNIDMQESWNLSKNQRMEII